jgi:hypothetical protein
MKAFIFPIVISSVIFMALNCFAESGPKDLSRNAVNHLHLVAANRLLQAIKFREGAKRQYQSEVAGIMGKLQQSNPNLPGRAFDILDEEFELVMPEVVDAMTTITRGLYQERFSITELNTISEFYETQTGQKTLQQLQIISSIGSEQGKAIGNHFGQEAARRAIQRIKKEGLELSGRGG